MQHYCRIIEGCEGKCYNTHFFFLWRIRTVKAVVIWDAGRSRTRICLLILQSAWFHCTIWYISSGASSLLPRTHKNSVGNQNLGGGIISSLGKSGNVYCTYHTFWPIMGALQRQRPQSLVPSGYRLNWLVSIYLLILLSMNERGCPFPKALHSFSLLCLWKLTDLSTWLHAFFFFIFIPIFLWPLIDILGTSNQYSYKFKNKETLSGPREIILMFI